jgi:predicted nucleic acid-binding protein
MGLVDACRGRRICLDANIFIYAVEGVNAIADALVAVLDLVDSGAAEAITSELTLAEVLVNPLSAGRHDVVDICQSTLVSSDHLTVLPVTRAILIESARFRSRFGPRLPDAVHVATAVVGGCDAFLSGDRRSRFPRGWPC